MSDETKLTRRKPGRPRKGEIPRISYEELDKILVHGEVVATDDGKGTTTVYPSYRALAKRFGVAHSLVSSYSKKHDCLRRREQAKARVAAKADEKLVELRSTAVALSKDDELKIIDSYLAGFEKALAEGKIRYDSPGDFDRMVRLKSFVTGGADSRQEVHGLLSLEAIQSRHQHMIRVARETSPEERGEVRALPAPASDEREEQEKRGQFEEPCAANAPDPEDDESVRNED